MEYSTLWLAEITGQRRLNGSALTQEGPIPCHAEGGEKGQNGGNACPVASPIPIIENPRGKTANLSHAGERKLRIATCDAL